MHPRKIFAMALLSFWYVPATNCSSCSWCAADHFVMSNEWWPLFAYGYATNQRLLYDTRYRAASRQKSYTRVYLYNKCVWANALRAVYTWERDTRQCGLTEQHHAFQWKNYKRSAFFNSASGNPDGYTDSRASRWDDGNYSSILSTSDRAWVHYRFRLESMS